MAMQQNRNSISMLNALSAIGLTLVNGVFGIIVTRMVIGHYGSDFNGLNSTANQIINVLLVIEGGFTLASNVALFAPLTSRDYGRVNDILSVTRKKFRRIGGLFFSASLLVTVGYTVVINSGLSKELVFTVMLMTVAPAAFNLYYATTYRVLLQTQQREYVINFITMITLGLGHLGNIIMIILNGSMWMVRFITMAFAFLNSLLIAEYVKKSCRFLKLDDGKKSEVVIRGTGDVMAQKITGVIYNSAPIVFLSISPSGGTILASVYAVYSNVFAIMKSLLRGVIDAPRLGIGQMLTESKREEVWTIFAQYEFIAFFTIFIAMNTAYVLILPFVSLYTSGVADTNYYDYKIALLMVLISVIEMIHIPSGHLINMAGEFKVSKNFQVISCVVLIITMVIGGEKWGVYGLLLSVLIVALLLAILEMGYVHMKFFSGKLYEMMRMLLPLLIAGMIACYAERLLFDEVKGVFMFIAAGCILTVVNTVIAVLLSLIFCRKEFMAILDRGKFILFQIKGKSNDIS